MSERREAGWHSYDAVADAYERVAAVCHAQIARDLVAAVAPPFRSSVLDVGAGTGVAALAAAQATGPGGRVVALDPSSALLVRARPSRLHLVTAAAPGLPFPDDCFDIVMANLVVGHFPDYRPALRDLARVLRPGGRLGITTWGRIDGDIEIDDADERAAYAAWDDVVGSRVDLDTVDAAAADALPWEDAFSKVSFIGTALGEVDLNVVDVIGRAYRYPLAHSDWLRRVQTSARGRYVRAVVGDAQLDAIDDELLRELRIRGVRDPIQCADEVTITVATRARPLRKSVMSERERKS